MTNANGKVISNRLSLLDYGRLAAALAVVAYHYFHNGILNGKVSGVPLVPVLDEAARYGYLGVHFFFMISGFVIFFSANGKSAGEFLAARALRLFPAFWGALALTMVFSSFIGGPLTSVTLEQFFANLTMFPQWFGQDFADGVYWTLQYEWRFYGAVFVLLLVSRQSWLERFFLFWPFWIFFARRVGLPGLPLAEGYFAFFACGALFALLSTKRHLLVFLSLGLGALLCWKFVIEQVGGIESARGVYLNRAVVTACLVGFFALFAVLTTRRGASLSLPGSKWAGAITYPLYLVHAHIGYMLLSRLSGTLPLPVLYTLVFSLVLGFTALLHLGVERFAAPWFATLLSGGLHYLRTAASHCAGKR